MAAYYQYPVAYYYETNGWADDVGDAYDGHDNDDGVRDDSSSDGIVVTVEPHSEMLSLASGWQAGEHDEAEGEYDTEPPSQKPSLASGWQAGEHDEAEGERYEPPWKGMPAFGLKGGAPSRP